MHKKIIFNPLCSDDLELLHKWFQVPHVKEWYARGETYSLEKIREKYLPRIHSTDSIPNYIIKLDDRPVGYIQMYKLNYSLPGGVDNYEHSLFMLYKPEEMVGLDLFIADENILRKGIGSVILNQFIEKYVAGNFKAVIVDPIKINTTAISFFEKNAFKKLTSSIDDNHLLMMHTFMS